jgi:hypothetical protein
MCALGRKAVVYQVPSIPDLWKIRLEARLEEVLLGQHAPVSKKAART